MFILSAASALVLKSNIRKTWNRSKASKAHSRPIQACRVHSGAPEQQVFVVVVFQIRAHSPQVPGGH